MPEEHDLDQAEKDRILQEELYRAQIRKQFADRDSGATGKSKVWAIVNSAFFLWLMSSVLLGSITFLYKNWEEEREKRRVEAQQLVEPLAMDLSEFVFYSDILTKGFDERWWKRSGLMSIIPKYNDAITSIRKKDYLYRVKIETLWGKAEATLFSEFMRTLGEFDDKVHKLNEEIGAVTSEEKNSVDFQSLAPVISEELLPAFAALQAALARLLGLLVRAG